MFVKNMLKSAVALALMGLAAASQAVSLGSLTVESRPGEPLEAILEIEDLDLTISPLLVRVAPPATYLREGVVWPAQVQDLKMVRDSISSTVRLRIFGSQQIRSAEFPLLLEMNAGGTVTVRTYTISADNNHFNVTASPVKTTVTGAPKVTVPDPLPLPATQAQNPVAGVAAPAAAAPAEPDKAEPKTEPKSESARPAVKEKAADKAPEPKADVKPVEKPAEVKAVPKADVKPVVKAESGQTAKAGEPTAAHPKRRRGRFAPNVVREYVALNGFDASQPFHVQRDMTLWSVVKLYWPSYRGATLEQTLIGFRNINSSAFLENDLNRLAAGSVLNPPKPEDVLAIDPMAAFREVHGDSETVPLVTQNLIDAQLVGGDVASLVADAQDRARNEKRTVLDIADVGRQVLEEQKARIAHEKNLMSDDAGRPLGAHRESVTGVVAEAAQTKPVETPAAEPAKSEDKSEAVKAASPQTEAPKAEEKPADKPDVKTEPVKDEPVKAEKPADAQKPAPAKSEAGPDKSQWVFWGILAAVVLALLAFLGLRKKREDGDDEENAAPKPQTVKIQKNVAETTDAQLAGLKATVDEAVKNGTTAGAMGVGAAAYAEARRAEETKTAGVTGNQPWIDPNDNELPPMDEEADKPSPAAATPEQTKKVIESVSLDFDDEDESQEAAKPEVKPEVKPAPAPEPEPKPETKPEPKPEPAAPAKPHGTEKERALNLALEAKLKLATSFVGLGALKEALELLDEVKRRGNDELRARAVALEERIQSKPEAK